MIDKANIKRSFSRAAETYETSSRVQKEVAGELTGIIASMNGFASARPNGTEKSILDIGCGTGSLARLLKDLYPGSIVTGCDIALPMVLKARELSGNGTAGNGTGLRLVSADCEGLPIAEGSFDLAASSLTYQWAPDTALAFKEAARVLRPKGLFIFSTLGPRTLDELNKSYEEAIGPARGGVALEPYKDTAELEKDLTAAGLEIIKTEKRTVKKTYRDLFELLKTLKNIGAFRRTDAVKGVNGSASLAGGTLLKKVSNIYNKRFPAPGGRGITATYETIYITAKKGRAT